MRQNNQKMQGVILDQIKDDKPLLLQRGFLEQLVKFEYGCMLDLQNEAHTYNGIFFSLEKEGNSDMCFNVSETQEHCAKSNKPGTTAARD